MADDIHIQRVSTTLENHDKSGTRCQGSLHQGELVVDIAAGHGALTVLLGRCSRLVAADLVLQRAVVHRHIERWHGAARQPHRRWDARAGRALNDHGPPVRVTGGP
jgi:hypothetical protein